MPILHEEDVSPYIGQLIRLECGVSVVEVGILEGFKYQQDQQLYYLAHGVSTSLQTLNGFYVVFLTTWDEIESHPQEEDSPYLRWRDRPVL